MEKKYWSLVIAAGISFSSCKNGVGSTVAHSVAGATQQQLTKDSKLQFALQLVQGAKYNYTTTTETTIDLEVENKKVKKVSNATIGLLYEVLQAAPDSTVIKLTYNKIHLEIINNDEKQVIDADKTGDEQMAIDNLMSEIKGSSLWLTMNSKGKIVKVTGGKEITDKVLKAVAFYNDEKLTQTIKAELSKLTGDEFVQTTLAGAYSFYPDTAIVPGQSWSKKGLAKEALQPDVVTKYTLNSIDDGIASIDLESNYKSDGTIKQLNLLGEKVQADLSQKTTGSIEVELATGILQQGQWKSNIDGTIEVMGRVVPVELTVKKSVSIKKI